MALFSDLKRIFFGAKSVAKHQASKAGEVAREVGNELREQGEDILDATSKAARDLTDRAPEYIEKGKGALEELSDRIWQEADAAVDKGKDLKDQASEKVNQKLEELRKESQTDIAKSEIDDSLDLGSFDDVPAEEAPKSGTINFEEGLVISDPPDAPREKSAARKAADSALDAAAHAGVAAQNKAGQIADKIGDISESIGKEVLEKGDDILNAAAKRGAELKEDLDDFIEDANQKAEKMKLDDQIEEAKRAAAQAEARAKAFDGKEASRDTSESILDGTDSFFERASRFAEGDYHNEGGKKMTIGQNPDAEPKPKGGIIPGFNDTDGDGDSLIDDAIIDDKE